MIKTIAAIDLAVDEKLIIKKNRLMPETSNCNLKRICIVTGLHGDELEGQYVCYEVNRIINENKKYLKGIVDIYPTLNPLGIDCVHRGMPTFDLDMNRIFPGSENGAMAEYVAARIVEDIKDSDLCIDIHASNIFLREAMQVRVSSENKEKLLPYADKMNTDFIWIYDETKVGQSTFVYNLNKLNVPTLMIEMGVGMKITKEYGNRIVDGIFNLMKSEGIWEGPVKDVKKPKIATSSDVTCINSKTSGIFIPSVVHWNKVKKDEEIGRVIDVLQGQVLEVIKSPCDGMIFTLREYPVIYEGTLIARIMGGEIND